MRKILIVGATSAIAQAAARIWAARGDALFLVARDLTRLESIAADLAVRGASRVDYAVTDATELGAHAAVIERAADSLGGLDTALIAHGTLSDQAACQDSVPQMLAEINVNALSVASLLTLLANRFERQCGGTIAVISSVAGDRGRGSNYVYGSAKALVSAFASGLRQRLHRAGVAVVTLKPGFVDTPMTAAFPKGALWAQPARVAAGLVRAVDRRTPVAYLPGFWRPIMFLVRGIPERWFRGLRL
jgi:decaprenylphospho-beta-D-erythro-pentofuranosid-2-ulose 2-reductase